MFGRCTQQTVAKLEAATGGGGAAQLDMETEFLNLGLDIIGLGVFNYDFGSITRESPVIKASCGAAAGLFVGLFSGERGVEGMSPSAGHGV
jgi:hypothetical protein